MAQPQQNELAQPAKSGGNPVFKAVESANYRASTKTQKKF